MHTSLLQKKRNSTGRSYADHRNMKQNDLRDDIFSLYRTDFLHSLKSSSAQGQLALSVAECGT